MNRTARRKVVYFGIVGGGGLILAWVIFYYRLSPLQIALIVIALIIPGRILGYFWRDLLVGLRLLNAKQFEESARYSQQFLSELAKRAWIKNLTWLGSGTYSRDPEALALNNLGAAEMCLGRFEAAEAHLRQSIRVDGENPLPYFNLGQLRLILDDSAQANEYLREAHSRGYVGGFSDVLIRSAQGRFAYTDGRKTPN